MESVREGLKGSLVNVPNVLAFITVERSDSGVSESHSRQSSEPFTGSSEEQDDRSKELEDVGQPREWSDDPRMQNIEEQIREQEVGSNWFIAG